MYTFFLAFKVSLELEQNSYFIILFIQIEIYNVSRIIIFRCKYILGFLLYMIFNLNNFFLLNRPVMN